MVEQPSPIAEALAQRGEPVERRETHTATVYLSADRAYKVKKPVDLGFLDFSTLERRRAACLEELRVNRELAPTLGIAVRAVVPAGDAFGLAEAGAPDAVEYAIEMRRFDEEQTMAAAVARGALRDADVVRVARRLADFHAGARRVQRADPLGEERRTWEDNLAGLRDAAVGDEATLRRIAAAERFAGAFLATAGEEIRARAAAGWIREGHGDLRAEHVLLGDPIEIVDRLEFDVRLREVDVADDLAFLVSDLERLGAAAQARLLVQAYRDAGGDPGSDALLAFYGAYRALVRAKVALVRARQCDGAAAAAARAEAAALLDLAERFAWRARAPLVVCVCGPPASGKSTLAGALARRSGWELLSSDLLRKARRGIAAGARAPAADYSAQARAAIYRELGVAAGAAVASGDGTIVDATFGDATLRAAFRAGLGDAVAAARAIECRVPVQLRAERARERTAAGAHGSDAGPSVAARLGSSYEGWTELPPEAVLAIAADRDPDALVDDVAAWLDASAAIS